MTNFAYIVKAKDEHEDWTNLQVFTGENALIEADKMVEKLEETFAYDIVDLEKVVVKST